MGVARTQSPISKKYFDDKQRNFTQTIVHIRHENKNFLKSAAALRNMPMYAYLDEILNKHREVFLKKIVTTETKQTKQTENQPKLE